jgi:hypothetical protein
MSVIFHGNLQFPLPLIAKGNHVQRLWTIALEGVERTNPVKFIFSTCSASDVAIVELYRV